MRALVLHRVTRWRNFAGELRAGATQWDAVVATALAVPVALLVGYWALGDWLAFSTEIVDRGGIGAMHVTSRFLAAFGFLVMLPMLVTAAYRSIYAEGELALLRGLPIGQFTLFALRFVPCAAMIATALLPVFAMLAATYVRVGAVQAVAWLATGWLLLSACGGAALFSVAVGLGGLKSARVGQRLADLMLVGALLAGIALFVSGRYAGDTPRLLRALGGLPPVLRAIPAAGSLFVVPEGGREAWRLLGGAGLAALSIWVAARLDRFALRRAWGSPWTPRRTASRRGMRRPDLACLPPQARALVTKDLPAIRHDLLALGVLLLFTLGGYIGLSQMGQRPPGAAGRAPWKTLLWAAFPHIFFMWIVPAATLLDVTSEERESLRLLRSLPVHLSRVLRVKFWVSWLPIVSAGLLLSFGLAWSGAASPRVAALVGAGFVPASAVCTTWALLLGRLLAPPRGSGTAAAPFFLYTAALALPIAALSWFAGRRGAPRTIVEVVAAAAFVLVLWLLPLPALWRRLIARWERG